MDAAHILSSVAHPTNACPQQMRHHLKTNYRAVLRYGFNAEAIVLTKIPAKTHIFILSVLCLEWKAARIFLATDQLLKFF